MLMSLVQEPLLGGNSLGFADKCRKGIAKKQGSLFQECEDIFYEEIEKQNLSKKLAHYVWDVLLKVQRGYSFNRSHCLAYSLIALQEMNLCFKYPIIYWNTACLITDSGSEDSGTDYDKIAAAIGKIRAAGVKIELPNINSSSYGFTPNEETNSIYCGFKSLLNVGEDIVKATIQNRPYISIKDYLERIKPNKQAMISLIKGGAFDSLMDRKICMGWYIWETCDKKKRITLQNMGGLIKHGLLPENTEERVFARRVYEFNRYLKSVCLTSNKQFYKLDDRALNFILEIDCEDIVHYNSDNVAFCYPTDWNKHYQVWMDVFREWINEEKDTILQNLNESIFLEDWNKYAKGSLSAWEMEALCFYYHEHELKNINAGKYGIRNFSELPEEPVVEKTFYKNGKAINIFKLYKICGTCIAKNKSKSTVSLLTTDGVVVNIKFSKEYFTMFDKQISERQADGSKKVIEKSFFNRGSKIIVQGIRNGDDFRPKKYASSGGHQLYKIDSVDKEGNLKVRHERYKGIEEDGE